MNMQQAIARWASDAPRLAEAGAIFPYVQQYLLPEWKKNVNLAMDAVAPTQPALSTTANAGIPVWLTTIIDPDVIEILFAPNKAAEIYSEVKKGSWVDTTIMFEVIEHTGEVSSYGDYSTNGSSNANTNFPNRQSYLFQTIKQYGDLELDRAGLAKVSWVAELDKAAALAMNKYLNFTYFFGVANLLNYGGLNDPNLSAALTPATKAATGTAWVNASGQIVATANEIYADIQALWIQLVAQTGGLIDQNTSVVLAMSPQSSIALTATNSFNVNVSDLLKKNFPNIRIETAVQYGAVTAANPQGNAAGNLVQMYAPTIEGQKAAYSAFNEKMRMHRLVPDISSYKQKVTGGSWGTVIRMPMAFVQMVGV